MATINAKKTVRDASASVTIRMATPHDAAALARLAALDSSPALVGPALVAEVGDELWAAVAIDDATAIADPFRPSGELLFLLVERASQFTTPGAPRRRRRRLLAARARHARPAT